MPKGHEGFMPQDAERPILIIEHDGEAKQHWTMAKDAIVLGRGEECDITINNRQISRQHIRIYREIDTFYIEDLDSKNGTWVNGNPLKGTRRLYDGDDVRLAMVVQIQFIGSNATAPMTQSLIPVNLSSGEHGRLRLDKGARRVFIGDVEIDPPLSLPQYRLLELLSANNGRICTRDAVVEAVWPEAMGEGVSEQAIDALVRRLRDRLSEIDPEWQYIVTVRGHGFRLDNPES